jgi:transposase
LAKATAKRPYRDKKQQEDLIQRALVMMERGMGVKDIASALEVSVPWVYGIPGLSSHQSWKASLEKRKAERHDQSELIFDRRAMGEAVRTIAADLEIPATSVRRLTDEAWIRRIEATLSFKEGRPPKEVAAELRTATVAKVETDAVETLIGKIRLRQVPVYHRQGMAAADIAAKLSLAPVKVGAVCGRIEAAQWEREERHKVVARLHGDGDSVDVIAGKTGLSKRIVTTELKRPVPATQEQDIQPSTPLQTPGG